MNKVYSKIIALVSLCVTTFGSVLSFDEFAKKAIIIRERTNKISSQIKQHCIANENPNDQQIIVCNHLIDEAYGISSKWASLNEELKPHMHRPDAPQIHRFNENMQREWNNAAVELKKMWQPLKMRPVARKLLQERVELINKFNDSCGMPDFFSKKPQIPNHKVDMCNQILNVVFEVQPTVEAMKSAELGFTEEELATFKPKRLMEQNNIDYWRSLQKKQ